MDNSTKCLNKDEIGGFDDRLDTALKNANLDDSYLQKNSPEHSDIYIVVDLTTRDHDVSACAHHGFAHGCC